MTTAVQRRRGTNTEHQSFTGLEGEITVNTTNESLHVHDGSTTGGFETMRADGSNATSLNLNSTTNVDGVIDDDTMATASATKLATSESIKAYVDNQVATVDTLSEVLGNGNTSGANNLIISSGQALTTNTISETTADSGVTIDSVLLKDNSVSAASIDINSSTVIDGVLDEDTLVSDSATKLATQQSIKAYVDTEFSGLGTAAYEDTGTTSGTVPLNGGAASFTTIDGTSGIITNTRPSLILDESDASSDYNRSELAVSSGVFQIVTRTDADSQVSQDYLILKDASGATEHQWRIANTEKLSLDSTGLNVTDKLLVGTTVSNSKVNIETTQQFDPTDSKSTNAISIIQAGGTQGNGQYSTGITFSKIGSSRAGAAIVSKQTSTDADQLGLAFFTHGSSTSTDTLNERAVLDHNGNFLVAKTGNAIGTVGVEARASGQIFSTVDGDECLELNRLTSDGNIVRFWQDTSVEGLISVSGSTVSYVGGHLSRWTQIESDNGSLLKGTVMTNLDDMCVWKQAVFTTHQLVTPAVEAIEAVDEIPEELDDEGSIIQEYVPAVEAREAQDAVYKDVEQKQTYSGSADDGDVIDFEFEGQTYSATVVFEDNEQLNKNAVSSVEGDPNVSGVFVNYDEDGDVNLAMTGDMVIRIAQGTTVARGDLLMSAGDGTAKPQGDDIVRSKTIAKVTSTNITKTYDDGSYLVPCVLMAC